MKLSKDKKNIILSIDEFNMFEETVGTFVHQLVGCPHIRECLATEYKNAVKLQEQIKENLGEHWWSDLMNESEIMNESDMRESFNTPNV